jgi:uncharacterized membrane protein
MKSYKILLTILLTLCSLAGFAQNADVEMADVMRSNGKIYVVVGIILIVLAGLIAYLFLLDKKVRNLEERLPRK